MVQMSFANNFLSLSNPERFWFDFIGLSQASLQIVPGWFPSWVVNHSNILLLLLISVLYQDMKGIFQKKPREKATCLKSHAKK